MEWGSYKEHSPNSQIKLFVIENKNDIAIQNNISSTIETKRSGVRSKPKGVEVEDDLKGAQEDVKRTDLIISIHLTTFKSTYMDIIKKGLH